MFLLGSLTLGHTIVVHIHTVIVGPQHVTIRGVPAIIPSAVYRWHMTNKTVVLINTHSHEEGINNAQ